MMVNSLHRAWYAVICGMSIIFYINSIIFIDDDIIHLGAEK